MKWRSSFVCDVKVMTRRVIFHLILSNIQNAIITLYWTEIVEIIKIALIKRNCSIIKSQYSVLFAFKIRNLSLSKPIFHDLYLFYSTFLIILFFTYSVFRICTWHFYVHCLSTTVDDSRSLSVTCFAFFSLT